MGQILLFTLMIFQESPFQQAQTLISDNDYYGAEGLLLSSDLKNEDIFDAGQILAEIAFVIANTPQQLDGKRSFYKGYLTRSQAWRGASLYVLSAISVRDRQWDDLNMYGALLLQEYASPPSPARFRLLYHLARHTAMSVDPLKLDETEKAWFLACRATPPDKIFPDSGIDGAPYLLRNLHLLSLEDGFQPPPPPEGNVAGSEADQYLDYLFRIKQALRAEDLVSASKVINELSPLDRRLASAELRVHYYPLLRQFFTLWERPERAERVGQNLELAVNRVVFHMEPDADQIGVAAARLKEAEEKAAVASEEPVAEEPQTVVEQTQPEEAAPKNFEELELRLMGDHRGLELSIRRMDPNTTFKKAYKNYLFGLYYYKANRLERASEHLFLAKRLAAKYPFGNLNTKILLTMADVHEAKGDVKDAEWARIQAAQIWSTPEHMLLFTESSAPALSPYTALIEAALAMEDNPAHSLLYYAESQHFQMSRRLAFKHKALSVNMVVGNQLHQVGGQLKRLVRDLAEDPKYDGDPQRYNSTLDLWNNLWKQVQPYYRKKNAPALDAIQKTLNNRDRILVFVAGQTRIGVVVVSKSQAFVVGLGTKANFAGLNNAQRFDYLEGRLGPVWEQSGKLWLMASELFTGEWFVDNLRQRMGGENLGLLFSLESLTARKPLRECRNILIMGPRNDMSLLRMSALMPQDRLSWLDDAQTDANDLLDAFEQNDQVILTGSLKLTDDGLLLQFGEQSLPLHQIIHRNNALCNLTLIDPKFDAVIGALPYLELISPDAAASFFLLKDPGQFKKLEGRRFGLHLP